MNKILNSNSIDRAQVFSPKCVDPKYVKMTEKLQKKFLSTHNELRNSQAMGTTHEHHHLNHPAVDMATMSWDSELELMSLVNAMRCKVDSEGCRRTHTYKNVGQNLFELCMSARAIYSSFLRIFIFC